MFLIDTNVWLELILEHEKAGDARRFFQEKDASTFFITEFSLYSIGIILFRLKKEAAFEDFLSDTIEDSGVSRIILTISDFKRVIEVRRRFRLDFDDAYQYTSAEKYNLTIVSFDRDFDNTELGRKTPVELLS
ncbi:MAG: type II toxin-antitoxin system VapC family toxin [Nitrospinae bacterium]|nr:type II toxin-antitoxin system VapC family toxin [Nitrospinota bacterium]